METERKMPAREHVPVLIVGGGLVGLSTALLLAYYGVSALLVERHASTTVHPKQFGLGIRAMEVFRALGLEEAVIAGGAELAQAREHMVVQTLAAGAITRRQMATDQALDGTLSPSTTTVCPQNRLEPLLLEAARQRGAEICFGTRMLAFTQDEAGVSAELENCETGARRTVRADYLVAADGAHSPLRRELAIPTHGAGVLAHQVNMYFRADIRTALGEQTFAVCVVMNPEATGVLGQVNSRDLWVFNVTMYPERGERLEDFTSERCIDLIRKATGLPELEIEMLSVLPWEMAVTAAQRLASGRVFLAGDSAHLMPPLGGFGASTGIQDAQNLAWKLAMVVRGLAAPELLASYEAEREPVDWFTVEQARLRFQEVNRRWSSNAAERAEVGMAHDLVVMLGYHYYSSALVEPRAAMPSLEHVMLNGEPGTRAPHLWIERSGQRVSTLDLLGQRFVLLSGPEGYAWLDAARAVSARLGLELDLYRAGTDFSDPAGAFCAAYGITSRGAVLARPDGFIGWRSPQTSAQPEQTLAAALAQLLGKL
ncbi:MAG TPA: FAD-dependent monooxygenase [Ktedonobacteraceae bacterium]